LRPTTVRTRKKLLLPSDSLLLPIATIAFFPLTPHAIFLMLDIFLKRADTDMC